jgi:antitoxin MazE
MGNSAGMIVPRSIMIEIGISIGAPMDMKVEDGKLIVTPVQTDDRMGWAEAAQNIAAHQDADAAEWQEFANEGDSELTW